jgi:bacillithiol system protein YtxJ
LPIFQAPALALLGWVKMNGLNVNLWRPVILLLLLFLPACGREQKMGNIILIKSNDDLERVLQQSQGEALLLFKHSTSCQISAKAFSEFQSYVNSKPEGLLFAMVRVIEERPLSQEIARRLGVKHESPQLLLIQQGKVVWHDSHWRITQAKINEVIGNIRNKKP